MGGCERTMEMRSFEATMVCTGRGYETSAKAEKPTAVMYISADA